MKIKYSSDEIKQANIIYHTKMADSYDKEQPHYMPENLKRVENIMLKLAREHTDGTLLDIGCGTGFILKIAQKYFKRLVGIDITPAMLDKVDLTNGNIEVRLADSSELPFEDEVFDVCTGYSFLHHLSTLTPTLKEIFRCLKRGGSFYVDLEPNYYCWKAMNQLGAEDHSQLLLRERDSIISVSEELTSKYQLADDIVKLAEFQKYFRPGLKREKLIIQLKKVGFTKVDFEYQWFLGQGQIIHNVSEDLAEHISLHLKKLLPISRGLFKYFSFIAKK